MESQGNTSVSAEVETQRLKTLRDYCILDTEPESRFDELTLLASRICETPIAIISLVDEERLFFKSAVGLDVKEIPSKHSFCVEVTMKKEPIIVKDAKEDERFASNPLVHSEPYFRFYAAAPLMAPNGHVVGTLCVIDYIPRNINLEQLEALQILSRQIITQLELDAQAIRDPLTDLFNRRYADEVLLSEFKRMERKDLPLGLMLLDIDHFKTINDTYGHNAGDCVLKSFGKLLLENIRYEDIACRIGGEEFMIILPETTLETTRQRAEAIRKQFNNMEFHYNNNIIEQLSVSAGVANYPMHGKTADEVLLLADRALYQAKKEGRNLVIAADVDTSRTTH
jgi:diguanylate cyclase (GGDEF)-like protein